MAIEGASERRRAVSVQTRPFELRGGILRSRGRGRRGSGLRRPCKVVAQRAVRKTSSLGEVSLGGLKTLRKTNALEMRTSFAGS